MKEKYSLSKYASIINRFSMQFFDHQLSDSQIGAGQYFFLARISEQQGLTAQELAAKGHFDKATATRALQRLEELSYIRREADAEDKRKCRFYTTPKAKPINNKVYAAVDRWNDILQQGMTQEEVALTKKMMDQMAKNAYEYISSLIEGDKNGRSNDL
ncbi:MAG: MarR family transcriptional regulator [Christensenella sp.]|uniref:MarR family winged helix-turn-helix transcriptional regulator n=1 Tax=Christensenella sp. TaxID=1935934 RepID=UPI002B205885|nr:MarR family transcriptional regulator [Christensenella sp.]MEA5003174.1 MarR family transcriptional regulator [Christensenella sp.]